LYWYLNNKGAKAITPIEYLQVAVYFEQDVADLAEHVSIDCNDWLIWKDDNQ